MKSAQQKWDEYLNDNRQTRDSITEMVKATHEHYGDYSFTAGYLQTVLADVIAELPLRRREELRAQMTRTAAQYTNKEIA